jgi:hypothetical protein
MTRITASTLEKRVKTFNKDQKVTCKMWNDPYGAPVPYIYYSEEIRNVVNNGWTEGWNIPNFHARKLRGELLPHTPFRQFSQSGATSGFKDQVNTSGTRIYAEEIPGYILKTGWVVTEDEVKAYAPVPDNTWATEAAAKIYNEGYDAFTALAELKESAKMFTSIGKTMLASPRALSNLKHYTSVLKLLNKKSRTRAVVKMIRDVENIISNIWIGSRYGLRPILSDLRSLDSAIKLFKEKRNRFSARTGMTSTQEYSSFTPVVTSWYTEETTICDTVTIAQRGSVTADIDLPEFQVNPLQTGWEIIPYSFVVDWFLDVGKVLAAASFSYRAQNYASSTGYRVTVDRTFHSTNGTPGPIYVSGGYEQTGVCSAMYEVRVPCTIKLFPQLVVRLNEYKIVDLYLLLMQRLK